MIRMMVMMTMKTRAELIEDSGGEYDERNIPRCLQVAVMLLANTDDDVHDSDDTDDDTDNHDTHDNDDKDDTNGDDNYDDKA